VPPRTLLYGWSTYLVHMYNSATRPQSQYGFVRLIPGSLTPVPGRYESTMDREIAAIVRREEDRRRSEGGTTAKRRPLLRRRGRRGARSATA
jgi:hypothetical protein